MKKQLNQLRRFFARTGPRKLNAATAREVIPVSYDDDDSSNRLSGAFIVVLVLHVIALVGVFAFSRMKDPKAPGGGNSSNGQSALAGPAENRSETSVSAPSVRHAPATSPAAQFVSLQGAKYSAAADPEIAATPERPAADLLRSPAPGSSRPPYVVKSGDNLTKIAIAFNVRPTELKSANNLKADDIKPGQELVIPDARSTRPTSESKAAAKPAEKPTPAKTTPATHKVRKNETLAKIARDLGVSYEDLSKLNGIKDPRKLQEGQILKVPRKS